MGVVLRQLGADFEPEFNRALALLQSVIDYLRPGYGFAFYEIGRLYRGLKRFDDAKASFKKSLDIPDEYRDAKHYYCNSGTQSSRTRGLKFSHSFHSKYAGMFHDDTPI